MLKKVIKVSLIVICSIALLAGGFFGWFFYQMRDLKPLETAKISDSLFVVKGKMNNVYLVKNNDTYVAFDAGDNPQKIAENCKSLGIDPALVKAVFLTHSDSDHVDGLPAFPSAKVFIPKEEEQLLKDSKHRHFLGMEHMNKLPVSDYATISDGELITIDGITVNAISTPGHTQGSMCYKVGGALFTGDLCIIVNGKVLPMLKIFTEDMAMDSDSIKKIAKLTDINGIYTAHTGYTTNLEEALKELR